MFCEKCGAQVPEGSAFCENCGTRVETVAAPAAPVAEPAAAPAATVVAAPAAKVSVMEKIKAIHKKNKLIFPIAGAVLVVAIALAVVFSILGKQVSMKDYLNITMEGYDGYGTMVYEFGDVSFGMRAAGDKDSKAFGDSEDDDHFLSYEKSDISKDYRDNLKDAQELVESVKISYTLPEGKTRSTLANGDVISFTIECDEDLAEELGLTIQDTSFEYTVEGLKPLAKFDVMSYYDLKAEGYDGYGNVSLVCNQSSTKQVGELTIETEAGDGYIRWMDKDGNGGSIWVSVVDDVYRKSNGDVVIGRSEYSSDYLISYGVEMVGMEREYTVSGLKESISVDFLKYYTVEFKGTNGDGRASIAPTQETATFGNYEVDLVTGVWRKDGEQVAYTPVFLEKSYSLTNGDETELYISYSEDSFASMGIKFTESRKKVTVSTLGDYLKTLSQIKDYADYEEAAKQAVLNYLEKSWSVAVHESWFGSYSNQSVGEAELYKMILATPQSDSYNHNDLWMVFKVTVSDNVITTPTTYYFTVSQDNVIVDTQGTLILDNEYFGTYSGRTSYDKLYQDQITYYSYNLNIEVSE